MKCKTCLSREVCKYVDDAQKALEALDELRIKELKSYPYLAVTMNCKFYKDEKPYWQSWNAQVMQQV